MRLKIGYYLSSNAIGGQERHVLTLIDRLRAKHDIAIFCDGGEESDPFCEEMRATGFSPTILRLPRMSTRGVLRPVAMSLPVILAARSARPRRVSTWFIFHAGLLGQMYAPTVASCLAGISTRILTLHNR